MCTLAGGGEGGGRNSVGEAVIIHAGEEGVECQLMRPSESFAASPDGLSVTSISPPEKCCRQIVFEHSFRSENGQDIEQLLDSTLIEPALGQYAMESRWNFFHGEPLDRASRSG